MRRLRLMLLARSVFLLGLVACALAGLWDVVLFNGVVFLGTLFVPILGRRDERFYTYDALIMLVFSVALIPSYFDLWNTTPTPVQTVFGIDKLFHMAGGACLALFAALYLRTRVRDRIAFYACIVAFALAIGGAWEVYEWIGSVLPPPFTVASAGYADSMMDMVADTLGALLLSGGLWLRRFV